MTERTTHVFKLAQAADPEMWPPNIKCSRACREWAVWEVMKSGGGKGRWARYYCEEHLTHQSREEKRA